MRQSSGGHAFLLQAAKHLLTPTNCLASIGKRNAIELRSRQFSPFKAFLRNGKRKGMEIIVNQTKLTLVQGDITKQATGAIVNAANSSLTGGGGVDGAIHRAGGPTILEECKQIIAKQGRLPAGKAVITTGGNLPAKYVIHAVGPYWQGGTSNEAPVLASCYKESLKIAEVKKLSSISFPSISTGEYRYPLDQAAKMALFHGKALET